MNRAFPALSPLSPRRSHGDRRRGSQEVTPGRASYRLAKEETP